MGGMDVVPEIGVQGLLLKAGPIACLLRHIRRLEKNKAWLGAILPTLDGPVHRGVDHDGRVGTSHLDGRTGNLQGKRGCLLAAGNISVKSYDGRQPRLLVFRHHTCGIKSYLKTMFRTLTRRAKPS